MSTLNNVLQPSQRSRLFWLLSALMAIVMALMNLVSLPLITEAAPAGIVSFELAGSVEAAQAMLASWDARAQRYAAFGLGFDYVFMLVYAAWLSLVCELAGAALWIRRLPLANLRNWLRRGMWLAAGLDAIENLGLAVILLEAPQSPWPEIAAVCAALKFGLLIAGLLYGLYGLLAARLAPRLSPG
jgi:hypothetical protein